MYLSGNISCSEVKTGIDTLNGTAVLYTRAASISWGGISCPPSHEPFLWLLLDGLGGGMGFFDIRRNPQIYLSPVVFHDYAGRKLVMSMCLGSQAVRVNVNVNINIHVSCHM